MTDWSRLSLNTATCKPYTLAECVAAAQAAGLGAVGPWRDRVQEVGAGTAAKIIADAGLRVSSLAAAITARDDGRARWPTRLPSTRPRRWARASSSWWSAVCRLRTA